PKPTPAAVLAGLDAGPRHRGVRPRRDRAVAVPVLTGDPLAPPHRGRGVGPEQLRQLTSYNPDSRATPRQRRRKWGGELATPTFAPAAETTDFQHGSTSDRPAVVEFQDGRNKRARGNRLEDGPNSQQLAGRMVLAGRVAARNMS